MSGGRKKVHTTWDDIGVEMVEEYDATTDQLLLRKVQTTPVHGVPMHSSWLNSITPTPFCDRCDLNFFLSADLSYLPTVFVSCARMLVSGLEKANGKSKLARITKVQRVMH